MVKVSTVTDILTLISSLSPMEQSQLKTVLLNDNQKASGIEQLFSEERFTGGLACPLCGYIGHISRNGHRKTVSKDISAMIVEKHLLLTPIPLHQKQEKTLMFRKSI